MPRTAQRSEYTKHEINIRYVAEPSGRERANPPTLGDLRAFVDACSDIPDEEHVYIEKGSLNEAGRHNYTFSIHRILKTGDEPDLPGEDQAE